MRRARNNPTGIAYSFCYNTNFQDTSEIDINLLSLPETSKEITIVFPKQKLSYSKNLPPSDMVKTYRIGEDYNETPVQVFNYLFNYVNGTEKIRHKTLVRKVDSGNEFLIGSDIIFINRIPALAGVLLYKPNETDTEPITRVFVGSALFKHSSPTSKYIIQQIIPALVDGTVEDMVITNTEGWCKGIESGVHTTDTTEYSKIMLNHINDIYGNVL